MKTTALIIDDEIQIRRLLRVGLESAGYTVHEAETGQQGLSEVWGPKSEEHRQYLRVYVTHLRQKIERDPASPVLIKTPPGIGYRFAAAE